MNGESRLDYDDELRAIDGRANESPAVSEIPAFRRMLDRWISAGLLWALPHSVRPNHLTVLRFLLTPVVLVLLHYDLHWQAIVVFGFAVCTDFMDGAMARTRDQITPVGIVIDPIADKLLIGSVMLYVGYEYTIIKILIAMTVLEFVVIVLGVAPWRSSRRVVPANAFGKLKMVFLSVGMFLFLIGEIFSIQPLVDVSVACLWLGLALALVSAVKQVRVVAAGRQA